VTTSSWARRATNRRSAAIAWAVAGGLACGKASGPPAARGPGSPPGASTAAEHLPLDFAFDSLDDRPVGSDATRGKPTVFAFVTTASLASQAQVDFLIAMAQNDADRVHYAVVALEPYDAREIVELYRKALAIPFPVAMADAATLAGAGPFGDVSAVPVTVVLDPLGRLVWRGDGRVVKSQELRAVMRGAANGP
jgi:hypothetical protein